MILHIHNISEDCHYTDKNMKHSTFKIIQYTCISLTIIHTTHIWNEICFTFYLYKKLSYSYYWVQSDQ